MPMYTSQESIIIMFNIPRTSCAKVCAHTQEIDYSTLHVAIIGLAFNHDKL